MTLAYELAKRASELLGDGEWHNYEAVMSELMRLVPPGRALRENERIRRSQAQRRFGSTAPRQVERSVEFQIASGARSIVRGFLKSTKVYEFDLAGLGGTNPQIKAHNRTRQIRMVGTHRQLLTKKEYRPIHLRLTELGERVELLRNLLAEARAALVAHGLDEEAARLVDPLEDAYRDASADESE